MAFLYLQPVVPPAEKKKIKDNIVKVFKMKNEEKTEERQANISKWKVELKEIEQK